MRGFNIVVFIGCGFFEVLEVYVSNLDYVNVYVLIGCSFVMLVNRIFYVFDLKGSNLKN